MIIIDSREPAFVHEEFDKLGIPYKVESIEFALDGEVAKFGDFTDDSKSIIIERKRVDDFYNSMVDGRLYDQLQKMDQFFEKQKYLILEGYNELKYFQDSLFEDFDSYNRELSTRSPISQVVNLHPLKKKWVLSQIKLCAEFNVALLQTYDLTETVIFVEQLCEGAGHEPGLRPTPKPVKTFNIEENILMMFDQIGKKRCKKILKRFGSLPNLIEFLKEDSEELEQYEIYKKLKEVFTK